MAHESGLDTKPSVVAELGPGDSLGIGLMSLLLGANKYFALDVVNFSNSAHNLLIMDELVDMLKNRLPIPNEIEYPRVCPKLQNYEFPDQIYSEEYLDKCLSDERINKIRLSLTDSQGMIEYKAPWYCNEQVIDNKVDMILSQAVLEHIDELDEAYKRMHQWLKLGGYMTHCIDFKSHGYADTWDGHWRISPWYWFLLRGKRPYLINRYPYSIHKNIINSLGFVLIKEFFTRKPPSFNRRIMNSSFEYMSDDDREISGIFIQVKKNS
jgi:hypothetical protein